MDKYAVIGHPVGHSLSPQIHAAFAEQTGQALVYNKLESPLDSFIDVAKHFFAEGGKGCNITLPFKEQAFALADQCSERATLAGAVNTLILQADGALLGDNTDGIGLVRDITDNLSYSLQNKRILILGAGGATRGVLQPLLQQQPASLHVANRTISKAQFLAQQFVNIGNITTSGFDELAGQSFDIIINATSAGLHKQQLPLPDGLVTSDSLCYDMMYAKQDTPFISWAKSQGVVRSSDGLGMLVEQAAESFYLWRQVRPLTQPVLISLRQVQAV